MRPIWILLLIACACIAQDDDYNQAEDEGTSAEDAADELEFSDGHNSTYERIEHGARWEKFKIQFKLHFKSKKREEKAFKRFIINRESVWDHKDNVNDTYNKEVNRYAIYSKKEFKKKMMTLNAESKATVRTFFKPEMTRQSVPENYDSRLIAGAVSYVRAQGECGGCWAFSTVGTLETVFFMKYKRLYRLSEQHLIDCDGFNGGCEGGHMVDGFNYIKGYKGLNALKLYPYEDGRGRCRAEEKQNRPTIIEDIIAFPKPGGDVAVSVIEDMMKVGVATHGAVAIGINAENMMLYAGGIYTGPCDDGVNHGVVLIGYGVCEITGLNYWIVRNSWGPRWGENGYIRIQRGNNTCGIAQCASVPKIADNINIATIKTDEQLDKE